MTKDYGARQSAGRKSKSPPFIVLGFGFIVGFLTAYFFKEDALSHWIHTQILAYHETKTEAKPVLAEKKQAPHAKPKFEFYTLLANEKAAAPRHEAAPSKDRAHGPNLAASEPLIPNNKAAEIVKPPSTPAAKSLALELEQAKDKGSFIVQVASFKARKDADHMKALLTLKGYEVIVTPISTPTGNWFRVLIGPYANRYLASKAQLVLLKSERLNGMVRRT